VTKEEARLFANIVKVIGEDKIDGAKKILSMYVDEEILIQTKNQTSQILFLLHEVEH
jgi:hypothetical protein